MSIESFKKTWQTLLRIEILLIIFFVLSLVFVYTQSKNSITNLTLLTFLLIAYFFLLLLFVDRKSHEYHKNILQKFCNKYGFTLSKKVESLNSLQKNKIKLFKNCYFPHIVFYARKKINTTEAEIYLLEHKINKKKMHNTEKLLILEFQNNKFGPGQITVISKKLNHNLNIDIEKQKKITSPILNLKFQLYESNIDLDVILSKININAILDYKIPIGISKDDNRILIFTNVTHLNMETLEKFWQLFDHIGATK